MHMRDPRRVAAPALHACMRPAEGCAAASPQDLQRQIGAGERDTNADAAEHACSQATQMVSTANVRAAVREHFACASADGAPLEDNGGEGTARSHWEESAFYGEVMVGVATGSTRRPLSPVTLALAQDSGWYEVNRGGVGFLRHGHLAGCEMLVCPTRVHRKLAPQTCAAEQA
jgi:hypothetical protein